jgi:HSP20 family protein
MIITRSPRPADALDRTFQQLTGALFAPPPARRMGPAIEATWRGDTLVLTVDLPGVPQDALSVDVTERQLTIGVNHEADGEQLRWSRAVQLGGSLDADGIEARYADGRLTVTVPPQPASPTRRVEILGRSAALDAAAEPD